MIYCHLDTSSESIGGFEFWALPRVGDSIYISFQRMLSDEVSNPGKYNEEDIATWRKWDGAVVEVDSVRHEVMMGPSGNGSHHMTVFVTRRAK